MNRIIRQAINQMRGDRFFTFVSILGTAVSIAFAMLVYMTYDIHTANIRPEDNRDRMVMLGGFQVYKTADHSNVNNYLSPFMAHALLDSLPGLECFTCCFAPNSTYIGADKGRGERHVARTVDANFFKLFTFKVLAGRLFTADDCRFDEGKEIESNPIVINQTLANRFFGSAEEAIGKNLFIDMADVYHVVGVVEDVSSLFTCAYSEVFTPLYFNSVPADLSNRLMSGGNLNQCTYLLRKPETSLASIDAQVEKQLKRLQSRTGDYTFEWTDGEAKSFAQSQFMNDKTINPLLMAFLLGFILLIVPAINISGLVFSRMQQRMGEIGIRQTYGATRWVVIRELLAQNLVLCSVGAVLGFLLSWLLIWLCKDFLLSTDVTMQLGAGFDVSVWLFLRPAVLLTVVLVCLLFNLLSVLLPAWLATRREIVANLKGE